MKKQIFTLSILVLLSVSCTVNKQTTLSQQSGEISNPTVPQTEQVAQAGKSTKKESDTREDVGSSTTTAVQKESDYNPFRYREEWKNGIEQSRAKEYQDFLTKECDALQLQTVIEKYNATKNTQFLQPISWDCNCPEVIDFAIDLINNSLDKETRKIAIGMLGFRKHYDAISLLLSHAKKEISPDEKIAIASALVLLDKKEEALEIFNCNCYAVDYMDYTCVDYYFYLSEDRLTGLNYFDYFLNKSQTKVEAASYLAKLGFCDKAFPIFAEFLKNNTIYQDETEISLLGLAAIWTEESFELIKMMTQNKNEMIAKRAQEIYMNYYIERNRK